MHRLDPQLDTARRIASERGFPAFGFRIENYRDTSFALPLDGASRDDTVALIQAINLTETTGRQGALPQPEVLIPSMLEAVGQELCRRDGYVEEVNYVPGGRVICLKHLPAPLCP